MEQQHAVSFKRFFFLKTVQTLWLTVIKIVLNAHQFKLIFPNHMIKILTSFHNYNTKNNYLVLRERQSRQSCHPMLCRSTADSINDLSNGLSDPVTRPEKTFRSLTRLYGNFETASYDSCNTTPQLFTSPLFTTL
uniref:Uncharacterized protein n=1 Tax=Glossina pallidipes TaxID=7398 RepID=A0A1A9ZFA4_GLOPL